MSVTPWFRTYNRMVDDEKLRLLAFEDRWHFMALCCLKNEGLLDEPEGDLRRRKIAVRMGLQVRELEEVGRRLREVELIDENLCPIKWDELQRPSDNSSERVKKFREKQRDSKAKRAETVTVTESNTKSNALEVEVESELSSSNEDVSSADDRPPTKSEILEAWAIRMVPQGFPAVRKMNPTRERLLRARLKDCTFDEWQQAFAALERSDFCKGQNDRGWWADFDFILQPKSFTKLIEGAYDH